MSPILLFSMTSQLWSVSVNARAVVIGANVHATLTFIDQLGLFVLLITWLEQKGVEGCTLHAELVYNYFEQHYFPRNI